MIICSMTEWKSKIMHTEFRHHEYVFRTYEYHVFSSDISLAYGLALQTWEHSFSLHLSFAHNRRRSKTSVLWLKQTAGSHFKSIWENMVCSNDSLQTRILQCTHSDLTICFMYISIQIYCFLFFSCFFFKSQLLFFSNTQVQYMLSPYLKKK